MVTVVIAPADPGTYAVAIDTGGAGMLNGDAAKYRVSDMVRSADARRASRSIAARRSAQRAESIRRVAASTMTLLTIPFRH